nr:MAG TPA: hypothetical protein [Caudoviricetes sp.]
MLSVSGVIPISFAAFTCVNPLFTLALFSVIAIFYRTPFVLSKITILRFNRNVNGFFVIFLEIY